MFSLKGFRDRLFFNNYSFIVQEIAIRKDFKRLITSGFLHVDMQHLAFNMLSFYFFADIVEGSLGAISFLVLYFCSLIGGNLLSLWLNKNNGFYSAVGASGAVSGVIFAAIALEPSISIFGFIPSWLYALGFIGYSLYGLQTKRDNIGHEAHLGGAIVGLFIAIFFEPKVLVENTFPILIAAIPSIIILVLLSRGVNLNRISSFNDKIIKKRNKPKYFDVDDYYRARKKEREIELNQLLEKVAKTGIDSLTKNEKNKLDDLSK